MAETSLNAGQVQKALDILDETKEEVPSSRINFLWQSVYAKALLADGQIGAAQNLAEQLYKGLAKGNYEDHREECYVCITVILSDIYKALNEFDLSIHYAKQALIFTDDLRDQIDGYKKLSGLYLQKNDLKTALQYSDSVISAKYSHSVQLSKSQFEANRIKLKVQEYQYDLIKEKERKKIQQYIFLGLTLFGLLVFFLVYKSLRNNVKLHKQKAISIDLKLEKKRKEHLLAENQKQLIEKELETTKLKQEQLKHKIAEKNRELVAKVLYHSSRNELIQDIVSSLEKGNVLNKEFKGQIRVIRNILQNDLRHDDFIQHFELVNPSFLNRVKEEHPQLSSNDIRFLCYVFMNLSLKEISSIFNISYNACKKRKKRIMDKMGFDKEEASLYDYVIAIAK